MTDNFPGMLTLVLFLCGIIFIVSAYLLQQLSARYRWKSYLMLATKSIFTLLSIISTLSSVSIYLILKPF